MSKGGRRGDDGRGRRAAYLKILKISSISESPGNSGFRVHISAKMQPTDHMSTPVEYWRLPSRISGARYQSVTTCSPSDLAPVHSPPSHHSISALTPSPSHTSANIPHAYTS